MGCCAVWCVLPIVHIVRKLLLCSGSRTLFATQPQHSNTQTKRRRRRENGRQRRLRKDDDVCIIVHRFATCDAVARRSLNGRSRASANVQQVALMGSFIAAANTARFLAPKLRDNVVPLSSLCLLSMTVQYNRCGRTNSTIVLQLTLKSF